jgi:hypothetical protein
MMTSDEAATRSVGRSVGFWVEMMIRLFVAFGSLLRSRRYEVKDADFSSFEKSWVAVRFSSNTVCVYHLLTSVKS